jgi:hypothetical protein
MVNLYLFNNICNILWNFAEERRRRKLESNNKSETIFVLNEIKILLYSFIDYSFRFS